MRTARSLGLLLIALPFLQGCRSRYLFYANFENDPVGQAPAVSPEGDPKGDRIGSAGVTVVELTGLPSYVVNRQQAHLVADTEATRLNCTFARKGLANPFYRDGALVIMWSGWTWDAYGRPMTVEARNDRGEAVARVVLNGGAFEVEGHSGFQNGYEGGDPHSVIWSFDLTNKTVNFTVNLGSVVEMTGKQALLAPLHGGLKRIHFGFAAESAQPEEGSYHFETISARWATEPEKPEN